MTAAAPGVTQPPAWTRIGISEPSLGVAERPALGTSARVVVWPARNLGRALAAADREIGALDRQASRFRQDSEITRIQLSGGGAHLVSDGLAEVVSVALAAARWTSGLVDPTVGGALAALGYDRDFAEIGDASDRAAAPARVPGWQVVRLRGPALCVPAGVCLDLGATAKGLGADRSAAAAFAACGRAGGVLVSLGGDLATAGLAPAGGWPILVANDHHLPFRPAGALTVQTVRLARGALATSSVTCRQWRRAGTTLHHILDPRTGTPAAGPWRTASVAAGDCATANAASTAAIILGLRAQAWLAAQGLPARLVGHDGAVRHTRGWPAGEGGRLDPPGIRLIARRARTRGTR